MPDKKYFYRSLRDGTTGDDSKKLDGHISNEEYLTCEKIWDVFDMKNMGDYQDHSLKKDVFLFAVSERFIYTCWKFYGLDPFHYFSSPGLNSDVKNDWCDLEKRSDIDKYLFLEKGLRGGISYIAKRYAKAGNKYMKKYNPKNRQNL